MPLKTTPLSPPSGTTVGQIYRPPGAALSESRWWWGGNARGNLLENLFEVRPKRPSIALGVLALSPSKCLQRSGLRIEAVFCLGRLFCLHPGSPWALVCSLAMEGPSSNPLKGQRGHVVQGAPPLPPSRPLAGDLEIPFLPNFYLGISPDPHTQRLGTGVALRMVGWLA